MKTPLSLYESLRSDLSTSELSDLRAEVATHLERLRAAQRKSELLPIDLAEQLAARLDQLLLAAPSMTVDARSAVVGAGRYFISQQDAVPDTGSLLGLDDDVEVFNHMAASISRPDLRIDE